MPKLKKSQVLKADYSFTTCHSCAARGHICVPSSSSFGDPLGSENTALYRSFIPRSLHQYLPQELQAPSYVFPFSSGIHRRFNRASCSPPRELTLAPRSGWSDIDCERPKCVQVEDRDKTPFVDEEEEGESEEIKMKKGKEKEKRRVSLQDVSERFTNLVKKLWERDSEEST